WALASLRAPRPCKQAIPATNQNPTTVIASTCLLIRVPFMVLHGTVRGTPVVPPPTCGRPASADAGPLRRLRVNSLQRRRSGPAHTLLLLLQQRDQRRGDPLRLAAHLAQRLHDLPDRPGFDLSGVAFVLPLQC